jgi:integrase
MPKLIRKELAANAVAITTKPGRYADGGGLYLSVGPNGSKNFVFIYRPKGAGRQRAMGLGAAATPANGFEGVTLAAARDKAATMREKVRAGVDPLAELAAIRAQEIPANMGQASNSKPIPHEETFGAFADSVLKELEPTFRNAKHRQQWKKSLVEHCEPIRGKHIGKVNTADMLTVLRPLWQRTPETANRTRGRIEQILATAALRGLRSGDNPARWQGHLKNDLELAKYHANRTRGHHPALPWEDCPDFITDLRKLESISALALEWTILTVARTGETTGARWNEINFAKMAWLVPAERMKAKKVHICPLPDRAIAILRELEPLKTGPDSFIFPGLERDGERGHLSNQAMLECLRGLREGVTVHGFRSSFRDWAGDATEYDTQTIEFCLAHGVSDKTEAAYRRGSAIEKRRALLVVWQNYLLPQLVVHATNKSYVNQLTH